jgi:hypothetical protein
MLIPVALVLVAIVIYFIGELRSLFAAIIGHRIVTVLNIRYRKPPSYSTVSTKLGETKIWFIRQFVWLYNVFVWIPRHKSSRRDLKIFFNRLLNTLSAYISFLYIFMMTTAAEIFVCTAQKNKSYTLNESSDILWYLYF